MNHYEIIGTIAAVLTTASFIPQVVKVLKTNDTKSISIIMYSMFTAGVSLWLVYGLLVGSFPIILSNAITLPMAAIILYKKIKNGK